MQFADVVICMVLAKVVNKQKKILYVKLTCALIRLLYLLLINVSRFGASVKHAVSLQRVTPHNLDCILADKLSLFNFAA